MRNWPQAGWSAGRKLGIDMRRVIRTLVVLLVVGLVLSWVFGSLTVRPQHSVTGPMGAGATRVTFNAADKSAIVGSYYAARDAKAPAILLLHGNGSSRGQFTGLAPWLNQQGYAVLAIDFRGHGESAQVPRSFGLFEARDAHAAFDLLKARQGGAKIGVVGVSLGGASALLGKGGPLPADALVLQAVYPDMRHAIRNRIASKVGGFIAALGEPLLSYQSRPRFGVWPDAISPLSAVPAYQGPVLVVGGAEDRYTPPAETRQMAGAANHLDRLWLVPELAHDAVARLDNVDYRAALLTFFNEKLKR
jgi:pimeloyl-ACP methyl ester carboxylesterase